MIELLALTALAQDEDEPKLPEPAQQEQQVVQQVIAVQEDTEAKLDAILHALAARSEEDAEVICDSGVVDCYRGEVEFVGPLLPDPPREETDTDEP